MGKFIDFCLQKKLIMYMLTLFILLAGSVSIASFNREALPKMNFPQILISVSGAALPPEEMEDKVTNPIEKELETIENIKSYTSNTSTGSTKITVIALGGKGEQVKQDVQNAVNRLRSTFPSGVKDVVVEQEGNRDSEYLMAVAVSGKDISVLYNLSKTAIKDRLEAVEGVKKVEIDEANIANKIQITFDPIKLDAYHITLKEAIAALQQANIKQAVGTLKNPGFTTVVEVDNSFKTIQQMNTVLIPTPSGNVPLSSIAVIEDVRAKKKDAVYRYNGNEYIQLNVMRTSNSDVIRTVERVKQVINELNKEANGQYTVVIQQEVASFVQNSITNLSRDVSIGAILAVVILFFFLKNWRVTLVISTTLPLSIMLTFISLKVAGYNIDLVTLISLSLAMGLIVDAAIVVLESIYHFREKGMPLRDAIKLGVNEVITPVLTSQLTIVVVFLPLILANLGGEEMKAIMGTIAFTVTAAIIASTISALIFVPVFSNSFLQNDKHIGAEGGKEPSRIVRWFTNMLLIALRRRWLTVLLAISLFAGAILLAPFVKMDSLFNQNIDENYAAGMLKMPKGSTLEKTLPKAIEAEEKLRTVPEIQNLYVNAYDDNVRFDIMLKGKQEKKRPKEEILLDINQKLTAIAGVERVQVGFGNDQNKTPIQLEIKGRDTDVITKISKQLEQLLVTIPGVKNPRNDTNEGTEKVILLPKQDVLEQFGLTQQMVMNQISSVMNEQTITKVVIEDLDVDVIARYPESLLTHPEQLRTIMITTPKGVQVPLSTLVDWKYGKSLTTITHKDGDRVATISAELIGSDIGTAGKEVMKKIKELSVPNGYTVEAVGDIKQQEENLSTGLIVFLVVIALIYLIMVAQFNRLSHPFIIMITIPMAIVGIVVGMVSTQRSLNELGIVGAIMLIGIVVSNAILLIDRINLLRTRDKLDLQAAILEAVRNRVRPIIMTKLTAILGMLPLALAYGEGSGMEAPLATVVIFGLLFHTIITLLLVPVLYSLFESFRVRSIK